MRQALRDGLRFVAVFLAAFATWLLVYGVLSFIHWGTLTSVLCATVFASLNGLTTSYQWPLDTQD